MANQFLGQLALVAFNFPPKGWAFCNGQLLAINQNQAIFALLGTTYGGNGQTTFALPNLQGRVPMSVGDGLILGETGGTEAVTLIASQLPAHTHTLLVSNVANGVLPSPAGNTVGTQGAANPAYASSANAVMDPVSISSSGSNQGHENRSPFLVLNWIIALQGIFPSQN